MKIVADENIPLVHEVFDGLGEVESYAGRAITAEQVKHADVLLVRSVTQVNEHMLRGSSVKFVGTCTVGTDHIDLGYLQRQGIGFGAAPGCNANAVVDYVISTLVVLAQGYDQRQAFDLSDRCVGIVGVGNVGSRLKQRIQALGMRCICTDPLLEDNELEAHHLVSLEQIVAEAGIISVHVPLTFAGGHPTHHLFNATNLARLKPNTVLINSARGPVVDNKALTEVLSQRPDITAVLDVWEQEPEVDLQLLSCVALATPHIAGYSLDGKINGTRMVYQALCRFFQLPESVDVLALAPAVMPLELANLDTADGLKAAFEAVLHCYDVRRDDQHFRQVMTADNTNRAASFDGLRKNYPVRRELGVTGMVGVESDNLRSTLSALGFEA